MDIITSGVLVYSFFGVNYVLKSLNAPPLQRPFWAFDNPPLSKKLARGLTWPLGYIAAFPGTPRRAVAYGTLEVVLHWRLVSPIAWPSRLFWPRRC